MQLHALDDEGRRIFAQSPEALRQCNYRCAECHAPVRLRGGQQRQLHFYHLASEHKCRLSGKSLSHLQTQLHIAQLLPQGECAIEQSFPEIQRIADLCWMEKKIIFEVQCSPISAEEVAARNRDYASLGFTVVWILHEKRFNQRRQTEVEELLSSRFLYYTDINAEGEGNIFDQLSFYQNRRKSSFLPSCKVDLAAPRPCANIETGSFPPHLRSRAQLPFYFSGDLIDLFLHDPARKEELLQRFPRQRRKPLGSFLRRGYRIVVRAILEKLTS